MWHWVFLAVSFTFAIGLVACSDADPPTVPRFHTYPGHLMTPQLPTNISHPETFDIFEAVYRHQFEHNASAAQRSAANYFLAFPGRADPPVEFIARFAEHNPPVAAASAGILEGDDGGLAGVKNGLLFNIFGVEMVHATDARVCGGYFEGGLSSSSHLYRVEKIDDVWRVTDDYLIHIA